MNKLFPFITVAASLLYSPDARCQDFIFKKNGDTIVAKVVRVNQYSVEFKNLNGTDTSLVAISKSYIKYITYKNGITDTFKVSDIQNGQDGQVYKVDPESHNYKGNYYGSMRLSDRGTEDAKKYYKKYKGAKTFAALSVFTGYGMVADLFIYFTPPKNFNLGCPYPELMMRQEYSSAYKKKAFQIKKRQTGNGILIGYGVLGGIVAFGVGILEYSAYHH